MLNKVVIQGRLTGEPELRTTTSGLSVTSFSIACNRSYKDEQTDFLNVVAWRQTAEFITKYFRKGSMILIEGSIQSRNYEDKNGNKRNLVEIVADNVHFCGSKADNNQQTPEPAFSQPDVYDFSRADTSDEFPF